MKKVHHAIALLLAALMCVSLTVGCGNNKVDTSDPVDSAESEYESEIQSEVSQPEESSDVTSDGSSGEDASGNDTSGISSPSSNSSSDSTKKSDTVSTKKKSTGTSEYFDVRDGIKGEVKVFIPWALSSDYDEYKAEFKKLYPKASIKYLVGEYVNRDVKLSAYIRANNAPDITPSGIADYPKRMIANMLQPIDGWVDGTEGVKVMNYADMKGLMSWNDKIYIIADYPRPSVVYYNKTLFKNEGVKTPLEYYNEGTWNWSNFKKAAKEMTIMDATGSNVEVYGFGTEYEIIFPLSAGVDIIDEKGALNTSNATLRKSLQFYYDMVTKDKCAVPNRWGVQNLFAKEKKVAMFYAVNDAGAIVNAGLKDFEVVPFPKADGQKDYYGHALTGGYGVPIGAKNPEGGIAFAETVLNLNDRRVKEGKIKTYYTDEQQKRIDGIKAVCTRLDGYGLAVSFDDQFGNDMRGGGDLASKLEEYKPIWQREIDLVLNGK